MKYRDRDIERMIQTHTHTYLNHHEKKVAIEKRTRTLEHLFSASLTNNRMNKQNIESETETKLTLRTYDFLHLISDTHAHKSFYLQLKKTQSEL